MKKYLYGTGLPAYLEIKLDSMPLTKKYTTNTHSTTIQIISATFSLREKPFPKSKAVVCCNCWISGLECFELNTK